MSQKIASILTSIRSELSEDEIKTLQEMLNNGSGTEMEEGVSLEDVMNAKSEHGTPKITVENYQSFEHDPRYSLISEGMKILESAEKKEDWAALREAKEKYPRAAAFISALLVATAAGPDRLEAGVRAMDRLLNEESVEDVLNELWKK